LDREGVYRRGEVGRDLAEWDKTAEAAGGDHGNARIRPQGRDEDRPSHDLLKSGPPPPGIGLSTRVERGDHHDGVIRQRFGIVGDKGLPVASSQESGALAHAPGQAAARVLDERVWRGTVRDDDYRGGLLTTASGGTTNIG
jgi:hypothetical protein